MRNPFRKKIKPRGQTKRPGPTLFFTGFMMSFFIFTILRVASMKLPINFFVPVMVCFSLAGSAFGAFFSHSFNAKSARAFHVLVMSAILIFLGAVFFNMKVPTVYMLFKAELPIELPPNAGFHSCAEIIALIFNGFVFCLLGYHFSRAFNQAQNAARSYALHLAGFFLGGLAAYIFIPVLGLYTCLMAAVLAIAFRYSGSRAMAGMAFLFSIVLVVFARHTTE